MDPMGAAALATSLAALAAAIAAATISTPALAAAALAVATTALAAAFAALHLHADERHPFVGRCRRGLSGGGPPIGERAVRSAERAAGRRCGWQ